MVTDGANARTDTHFDPTTCDAIKNTGTTLVTLHVAYNIAALDVPGVTNSDGTPWIYNHHAQGALIDHEDHVGDKIDGHNLIEQRMRECASNNFYFKAEWEPEIEAAFEEIHRATAPSRPCA